MKAYHIIIKDLKNLNRKESKNITTSHKEILTLLGLGAIH